MLNRRRMILMNGQEVEEMKKWVTLEDITLEEAQKWNKTYDNSYTRYITTITIPKDNTIEDTTRSIIFGSGIIYYIKITTGSTYPYVIIVDMEKVNDQGDMVIRASKGSSNGMAIYNNDGVKMVKENNAEKIITAFELPVGTRIQVYAK